MNVIPVAIAIELDHGYPWHQDCYAGIMRFAKEIGWKCIVDPHMVGMQDASLPCEYRGIVGRISDSWHDAALQSAIPMVNIWSNSPVKDVPSVFSNYSNAATLALDHLVDSGFNNITYVHMEGDIASEIAKDAINATAKAKSSIHVSSIAIPREFEAKPETMIQFRNIVANCVSNAGKPTGIIASQVTAARYVAQICYEMDIAVPGQIGIITLQDTYHMTESAEPCITSVEHDFFSVGYKAAATLHRIMTKQTVNDVQYIAPRYIIERDSTDIFHCKDPMVTRAVHYIKEHIKDNIDCEDVAGYLRVSSRTAHRYFQKYFDKSVPDVIAQNRINALKKELLTTNKSLLTISQEFNFSSSTQMARFFYKFFGQNPSEFRKEHPD